MNSKRAVRPTTQSVSLCLTARADCRASLNARGRALRSTRRSQKPTALAKRALNNSSKPGEIVLELFCGSGSTLIACEQSGRTCYAMERDPVYIDVEVERYCRFTGKKRIICNGQEIEWQLTDATADKKVC